MEEKFIICEGCGRKILIGDELIDIELDPDVPAVTIHKNLECLLKLDGVDSGTLTDVQDYNPYRLKRIK